MYCCGSLYSIFIGETRTAVEEDELPASTMYRFVNISDDAGKQNRILEIREVWSLTWPNDCLSFDFCLIFFLFFFFYDKTFL